MFGFFLMCTEGPRPSGYEGIAKESGVTPIAEKIKAVAKSFNLEVDQDTIDGNPGNVRIRVPATAGLEKVRDFVACR